MGASVTYANGQTLTSTALTQAQLLAAFQQLTCSLLGIAADDPAANTAVRESFAQNGQPAWLITDDVCFIRAVEEDGWYNAIRDEGVVSNSDGSLTKIREYTRIWRVFWNVWGPNCQDRTRIIKSGLLEDVGTEPLALINMYVQPDLPTPVWAPELEDGQWWKRTTFEAVFNEQVIETINVPTITSVEVKVETANGAADFIVTRS